MNDTMGDAYTPPLHYIQSPYKNMNGKKIIVFGAQSLIPYGKCSPVGEVVTYERSEKGLFGIRIDVIRQDPPEHVYPIEGGIIYGLMLAADEINRIEETGKVEAPYSLEIRREFRRENVENGWINF